MLTEREIALYTERLRRLGKYDDSEIGAILEFVDEMSEIVLDLIFNNHGTEETNEDEGGEDGPDEPEGSEGCGHLDPGQH